MRFESLPLKIGRSCPDIRIFRRLRSWNILGNRLERGRNEYLPPWRDKERYFQSRQSCFWGCRHPLVYPQLLRFLYLLAFLPFQGLQDRKESLLQFFEERFHKGRCLRNGQGSWKSWLHPLVLPFSSSLPYPQKGRVWPLRTSRTRFPRRTCER